MNFLKRYKKIITKAIVASIVSGALVGGCSYINKNIGLQDDNIFEECIEEKIDEYTGIDIDLSPYTPEKKKNK